MLLHDGNSTWLKGLTLLIAYAILSVAFWLHLDPKLREQGAG